jgi:serine/threonine-protein kinase RsbW
MNQPDKGPAGTPRALKMIQRDNEIEIPSTLDFLPKVDEFIERKLRKLKINKDQIADIAISVSEAVTNAVEHGNRNDITKKVKIRFKADTSSVEVIVEDEGGGFDPSGVESCLEEQNLLKDQGRGILILKSLMDQVDIVCKPNRGTKLKMIKFLT